ncbi:MAG TPA: BPL-N domain-containing protein [Bacteroidales bacterium]|nr:BPL-N domain-containing protein [Bacteroidales bacterium]HPA11842.1 BPL-N domain-containing protein [Bacteroidales bacterium]HQO06983.1 BPL-N domain-containing protein [Bacteroidales bacterium]HQP52812.1 BPL-N domain-containing protein [Bacteroidales bacterium]
MKLLLPIIFLLFFVQCTQKQTTDQELNNKIQVAVFDGHGGAQTCIWETVAAVKLDTDMSVRTITTANIANNVLDSLDAIIIPGGGGSRQFLNLSALNQQRIKDFVASGGGIVGICAGAYLLSNTPDYACMQLNGAQAIDIEHDNRGHGISKFTLTDEGKKIFPEIAKRDTLFVMYYEGPVFIKKENDTISYETLAIMESDVHEEGNAPKNMTNNKPFFITNSYGKGRIFSSIAHPEATPGMMWMIPRMVRWTLNLPIKEYKSEVVNPDIFNREILMSISDLKQESAYYQTFLYGSAEEKIVAMDWLQSKHSWAAKRWVQGLLFDADASVRVRAAKYIADTHYIHYLPDLRAAYNSEKETQTKQQLKEQLDKLENIRDGF